MTANITIYANNSLSAYNTSLDGIVTLHNCNGTFYVQHRRQAWAERVRIENCLGRDELIKAAVQNALDALGLDSAEKIRNFQK